MKNSIEIEHLSKSYPNFHLNDVSFVVPEGSIVGLIGENGAGKTTTIKLLLGIIQKESGTVRIFGKNIDQLEVNDFIKEQIGVVMPDSFLSDYMTPQDLENAMCNFFHDWDRAYYQAYVTKMNIPLKKRIRDLSTGMKVKLKIGAALAHHPKLLILDEPTSGLDPIARNEILDTFREFVEDGKHSILLSSHITSDLEHIADYVTFIHKGQIVLNQELDHLLDTYGIVHCSESEFSKIDSKDCLRYQKNKYDYQLLVANRDRFKKKYNVKVVEKPTIENIMLLYIKGEEKK